MFTKAQIDFFKIVRISTEQIVSFLKYGFKEYQRGDYKNLLKTEMLLPYEIGTVKYMGNGYPIVMFTSCLLASHENKTNDLSPIFLSKEIFVVPEGNGFRCNATTEPPRLNNDSVEEMANHSYQCLCEAEKMQEKGILQYI